DVECHAMVLSIFPALFLVSSTRRISVFRFHTRLPSHQVCHSGASLPHTHSNLWKRRFYRSIIVPSTSAVIRSSSSSSLFCSMRCSTTLDTTAHAPSNRSWRTIHSRSKRSLIARLSHAPPSLPLPIDWSRYHTSSAQHHFLWSFLLYTLTHHSPCFDRVMVVPRVIDGRYLRSVSLHPSDLHLAPPPTRVELWTTRDLVDASDIKWISR
ncbi:hypothetical protein PFISCL1PPCAC_1855, partial [Pristionchus fissidentatus]